MLTKATLVLCLSLTGVASKISPAQQPPDSADQLVQQAAQAIGEGGYHKAIELLGRAADFFGRNGRRSEQAALWIQIGAAYLQIGEPDSAALYGRRALTQFRELHDSAGQAFALNQLGTVRYATGDRDTAITYFQHALQLRRALHDTAGEAELLGNFGVVYAGLGKPDSALAYYRQALPLLRAAGKRLDEGTIVGNIGDLFLNTGRVDSALVYLRLAAEIANEVNDRPGVIVTLNGIAGVYRTRGQMDSALSYSRRSLRLAREIDDRSSEAVILKNIGAIHHSEGRPDSALADYRGSLKIRRTIQDRVGEGRTLHDIGLLYIDLGYPDSALAYFRPALAIARGNDRQDEGTVLNSIAVVLEQLGQTDSALADYRQALQIRREIEDLAGVAGTLNNIGLLFANRGQPDTALSYYRQALAIARQAQDRYGEGVNLHNIGGAFRSLSQTDSALAYFRMALEVRREIHDRTGEGATYHTIGTVYSALGRVDSALTYFQKALAIERSLGDKEGESTTLYRVGRVHHRVATPPTPAVAAAYYDTAATVKASIRLHAGGDVYALGYAERDVPLVEDWTLAWLARRHELGANDATVSGLAASEQGRAQALLDLMRGATGHVVTGRELAPAGSALLSRIGPGVAVLSYLVTSDTLLLWISVSGAQVSLVRTPVARDTLLGLVATVRRALGVADGSRRGRVALRDGGPVEEMQFRGVRGRGDTEISFDAAARRLSKVLLPDDLAKRLGNAREIIVVPHGALGLVPFAALPFDSAGIPLGRRYAIRYTPSLAALRQAESRRGLPAGAARTAALRRALVVGNPTMPDSATFGETFVLAPLPQAEVEGRWVARRFGSQGLIGPAATEATVRRRLAAAPVVHLATHGYAYASEGRVRQSFIALARGRGQDGFLTIGEVLDAPAPTLSADLVVLSACQTGLGDLKQAEGTVGLQRAFLAKGARSVLVSLWSVSDQATALLMRRFYTHWLGDRDRPSKAESLRRAQEEVRARPEFRDPLYWAAFQLVGAR
jgi:tetratricopeptide (TPR) repeat protein